MHKKKTLLCCLLIVVFVSPIFGMLPLLLNSPVVQPIDTNNIQSDYVVTNGGELTALSHTIRTGDVVSFDQVADITGVTLENFSLLNEHNFQAYQKDPYILNFAMDDVLLTGNFKINGSPTISATDVNVSKILESLNYDLAYRIGSPNLSFVNLNATVIRFRVNDGTFSCSNAKTTTLILEGFQTATIQSSAITGAISLAGAGNVSITGTTYGSIVETINPTLVVEQTSFSVPYNFVFQPNAKVTINWAAYDNVQGPGFDLQTNLSIYKNGVFQETIADISTTSRQITIQTAAALYEVYVSVKDAQGNTTSVKVTIATTPNLLYFILMIAIIAGAAVGIVFLFYWRKQRQWQKTSLVEIPA